VSSYGTVIKGKIGAVLERTLESQRLPLLSSVLRTPWPSLAVSDKGYGFFVLFVTFSKCGFPKPTSGSSTQ